MRVTVAEEWCYNACVVFSYSAELCGLRQSQVWRTHCSLVLQSHAFLWQSLCAGLSSRMITEPRLWTADMQIRGYVVCLLKH